MAVVCVLTALSFGLSYAQRDGNQLTYVLEGLRRANPSFLSADWLATETYAYHPSFMWVVYAADRLGSVAWILAIGNVVTISVSLWLVYRLVRAVAPAVAVPAFLTLAGLVVLDGTASVGQSYIFSAELQPSGLAALALIAAVLAFVTGRPLVSGIALATSGALHSNFLLVGLAAFGLAQAVPIAGAWLGRDRAALRARLRDAVVQLAPAVGLVMLQLPLLLSMTQGDPDGAARGIFLFVRSPHHYVPETYLHQFMGFTAWPLLAYAALGSFPAAGERRSRLVAVLGSTVALVVAATLLTTVIFVPVVSQLFVWRLAPFAILLAQLVAVTAAVHSLSAGWRADGAGGNGLQLPGALGGARIAAGLAGGALLLRDSYYHHGFGFTTLVFGVLLLAAAFLIVRARTRRADATRNLALPVTPLAAVVFLAITIGAADDAWLSSNLIVPDLPPGEAELYDWARTTPAQSRFLTPPELSSFRLRAGRAIIVDWKSTPIRPEGLLEWYRRINAVSGVAAVSNREEAAAGYAAIDSARLRRLVREFEVDFAVLPAGAPITRSATLKEWPRLAWSGKDYVVLDVRY